MARNFVQPGSTITLTAPSGGVVAGTGYIIGGIFVVAQNTAAQGLPFEGMTDGVHDLGKTAAVEFDVGEIVAFDASTKLTLENATGKYVIGVAVAPAAGAAATSRVRLNGVGVTATPAPP